MMRLHARHTGVIVLFILVATLFNYQFFNWALINSAVFADYQSGVTVSSPLYMAVKVGLTVSAVGLLLIHHKRSVKYLGLGAPATALMLWAILTAVWSADRLGTLQAALSYAATLALALAAVTLTSLEKAKKIHLIAVALVIVGSYALVLFVPKVGVHQVTDSVAQVHAGDWRGTFDHRSSFGEFMAFAFGLFLCFRRTCGRWLSLIGMLAALAGVIMSRSGGSLASAVLIAACYLIYGAYAHRRLNGRLLMMLGACLSLAVVAALSGVVVPELLLLFGKDPTLTGRTLIWTPLMYLIWKNPVLGYGFETGYGHYAAPLVWDYTHTLYNAHNGYILAMIYCGAIGTALLIAVFGHIGYIVLSSKAKPGTAGYEVMAFGFVFSVYALWISVIEGFIMSRSSYLAGATWLTYFLVLRADNDLRRARAWCSLVARNGRLSGVLPGNLSRAAAR
ncbi:MAG: O-antigen ligase family protein [Alphaproteobacteria bacterium]|nr:O-antigen ligase family protein [Alphaproteobacteria bacterium]MDE2012312.1 O-antigen ligase family protein [Alphaproteobacteria bacterium]MDE2072985.1 O-antigen ligase family protein [Alphaproteobacteria bacterium]MDE2352082.1 O-antigen ligase family protein [Alphaproteobacteria bacterium]